jgi:hypothetical protein
MTTEAIQGNVAEVEESTPAAMLQMAGWHARSGDTRQAERCYRWILEREPNHVTALQRLALLLLNSGMQANDALPLIEKALVLQRQMPRCMRPARSSLTARAGNWTPSTVLPTPAALRPTIWTPCITSDCYALIFAARPRPKSMRVTCYRIIPIGLRLTTSCFAQ